MLSTRLRATTTTGVVYSDITVVASGSSLGNRTETFSPTLQENDVVFIVLGEVNTSYTMPSGYVQIVGGTITGTHRFSCWYKVMGSTPDANINLSGSSDNQGYTYYALRGVQTQSPVIEVNFVIGASSANLDPPALPAFKKCFFLAAAFTGDGASAVISAGPSGYTGFLAIDAAGGSDTYVASAYKTITTTGTEDPGSFSLTNTAAGYASFSVVVRPFSDSFSSVAPEFIAMAQTQRTNNGTTLTIDKPTSTTEGDLMIAVMAAKGGAGDTWTGDTDWTEIADQAAKPNLRIAYKVAGSSEGSSYTFTCTKSDILSGTILTYRYAAYDTIGSFTSTSTTQIIGSISPSASQSVLIAAAARDAASITVTVTPSMTIRATDNDSTAAPSYRVFDQTVAKGPTSTRTTTTGGTGSGAIMLAIKPTRSL
jgi:hypothetical protein